MRSIELLAPARNLECGLEAIRHGADAVYIGAPRFGARAAAGNSIGDIAQLVDYAHLFGARIYVTVNTLLYDEELSAAQALIDDLAAIHVDALITQDPRILPPSSPSSSSFPSEASSPSSFPSKASSSSSSPSSSSFPSEASSPFSSSSPSEASFPSSFPSEACGRVAHIFVRSPLPLHSSTQMDNRTLADVLARQAAGYEQVVLARELSLEDIRAIHAAVPSMPLEAFVHGALCVSYSGRCYASEYCFGRSANRGECAQFCRLPFDLLDEDGRVVTVPENASPGVPHVARSLRQRHLLSLRDMNRSADLEAMMDAGISSFKIEGRLKDVSYVKNLTAYYRQRIDAILARRPEDYCRSSFGRSVITFTPNPAKSFNRGFTSYFLHERTTDLACHATPKSIGEPVGIVKDITRSNHPARSQNATASAITVAGSASFSNGDGLCFFDSSDHLVGFRVNRVDQQGRLYPSTLPEGVHKGTRLYRNYDAAFERELSRPTADRRLAVRWLLEEVPAPSPTAMESAPSDERSLPGFRLTLTSESGCTISRFFPHPHEAARTPQAEPIRRQLLRLGDTPLTCSEDDIDIRLSADYFIPASTLADWRRQLTEELGERGSRAATIHSHQEAELTSSIEKDRTAQPTPLPDGRDMGVGLSPLPDERGTKEGLLPSSLMTCRYCLRHAIGQCLREHPSLRGPLSLRLADGRRFPLRFDCQRCEMHVLRTLLVCLLFLFGVHASPLHAAETERPYSVGYNFRVHADSLLLQEDRPMHWCQGVAQSSDSLWVFGDDHLVVAAITIIPEDCVDSVWVKVARDQATMGWTHESALLAAVSPDDPISQFVRIFSSHHLPWFLAFITAASLAIGVRHLRRRHLPRLYDLPSAYPTLLSSTLAVATTTYAHIQHYLPEQWVRFYFHPTLNPLAQPAELCLFLLCVWLLLLLSIAVADAAFSQLRSIAAVAYLATLLAACILIYLLLSLASQLSIYLTYALCALYILATLIYYFTHVRAHYLCGRCGAKMRQKGVCPRCGAVND